MWDLSSLIRDRTCVPCIRRRILNHWTTREVSATASTSQSLLILCFWGIWHLPLSELSSPQWSLRARESPSLKMGLCNSRCCTPRASSGEASLVLSKCRLDVMFPECHEDLVLQKRKVSSGKSEVQMVVRIRTGGFLLQVLSPQH